MKKINLDKKKTIIIIAILFTLIVGFIIIKANKKNGIVYTKESSGHSRLPHINIDTQEIGYINSELLLDYEQIIGYDNESYMTYEYSKSDNILSVLVEEDKKKKANDFTETTFLTYNIDLKSNRVLTFNEVLDAYGLDYDEVKQIIEIDLRNQYDYEVYEGYIPEQDCGFSCYLTMKNYESIDNNLMIYKNKDKIYGFLNLKLGNIYYSVDDYPVMNLMYELK